MWLRTLLLFLLVVFVLRFIMRLVRGIAQGMASSPGEAPPRQRTAGRPPVKMVADPVCGTYVIPGKSIQATRSGDTQYFCSDTCRDRWLHS